MDEAIVYNDSKFPISSFRLLSSSFTHLSKRKPSIQLFVCPVMTRKVSEIFESSRFHCFPITKIGIFYVIALAADITQNRTLLCLPP